MEGSGCRLSPAQAPASAPFTQGLLKSALSLAVFPELEGLRFCSTVHVISEQMELALSDLAPLQVEPEVWWEEHRVRSPKGKMHPGPASACSVTLSKYPPASRLRLLCPRLLPALKVSHYYTSEGSSAGLRSLGPILSYLRISPYIAPANCYHQFTKCHPCFLVFA